MLKKIIFISIVLVVSAQANYKELKSRYKYQEAKTICKDELGFKWRLPEIWELFGLRAQTGKFGKNKKYWSNTKLLKSSSEAYSFYLEDGDITPVNIDVRSNIICTDNPIVKQDDSEFVKTQNGTIDKRNSILWEPLNEKNENRKMTYENAQEYCEASELQDKIWRLPTIEELFSTVNYNFAKPTVDNKIFLHIQSNEYWSNDEYYINKAYSIDFSNGSLNKTKRKKKHLFRCISEIEDE